MVEKTETVIIYVINSPHSESAFHIDGPSNHSLFRRSQSHPY